MRLAILNPGAAFRRRAIVDNDNDCILTPDNIDNLPQTRTLISNFGVHALNAHEITIITGTECARTALFAKMLAATALSGGKYPFAENMCSNIQNPRVLWVDSVMPYQAAVQFTRDMKQHFNATADNFRFVALTALGSEQDLCGVVQEVVNKIMLDYEPNLVIFNDLDHLFPSATWLYCRNFVEYLRDYVNMHDAAVCAIGHNLIGKIKKTSGYAGEIMLPNAGTIYRVSDRSKKECGVTRVSCYKNSMQCPQDFTFVVNEHNFPQQVIRQTEQQEDQNPPSGNDTPQNNQQSDLQQNNEKFNKILTFPPKFFSRFYPHKPNRFHHHPHPLFSSLKYISPPPPPRHDLVPGCAPPSTINIPTANAKEPPPSS